ncbi:PAS domain-containing sensor histidine kinase [Natronomonas salina]|uniref:PAS domain-containing sensor histidine kinase n=1 Tax=Natronomonas salina TaxID=1710540 RepID=UPI0015B71420|nr:PAS domain S-box protein [Natronomonas salina]QLD90436.1 PAS domain-containing sensor histidine kinase [Natronomonas salina]
MDDPAKLRALLDHAQDKLVVVDETGTYRYANDAVERLLGYAPAEIVGQNTFEFMHPADRDRVRGAFQGLVDCEEPSSETAEYRHRTAGGDWVWLESLMSNNVATDLGGYVVSSRDVTDRKRAEERERRTEARLQQLAANAADVLWMFTGDWSELVFVNEAYERIYGQSIDEVRAEPTSFVEAIHPDDRQRVREYMERNAAGEATDIEYRVNPHRDYRRWVWVKAQPIVEAGEVTHIVGFSRDITDRRRRERQLRVMDNLLRHNLRNDMNVILGHAEIAKEQAGAGVADSMNVILETGEKLLETAAKEREIIDVLVGIDDRERVDLVALLGGVLEAFRSAYPAASVTVTGPDAVDAVALPEFRRALDELLENAAEHADADPEIGIEVRPFADHVEIEIRDNAPPIPGNEFEPLVGKNESDEIYHGTGLGLWLVYWVVDLSDGDIDFDCDGDGNVVTISLPRAHE